MDNINVIFNIFKNIDDVIKNYEPVEGFIYCLHNKMYSYNGTTKYKCGYTNEPSLRIKNYVTPYLDDSKYIFISQKFFDKKLAEKILFFYLRDYRIKINREFFECDDEIIKIAMDKVKHIFDLYNDKFKMATFLFNNKNYDNIFSSKKIDLFNETSNNITKLTYLVYNNSIFVSIQNENIIKKIINIRKKIVVKTDIENEKYIDVICNDKDFLYYLYNKHVYNSDFFLNEHIELQCAFCNKNTYVEFINNINTLSFFRTLFKFKNDEIHNSEISNLEDFIYKINTYIINNKDANFKKTITNLKDITNILIMFFEKILNKKYDYEFVYSKIIHKNQILNFYKWFNENYIINNDIDAFITISDMLLNIKKSNFYITLTKNEKRKITRLSLLNFFYSDINLKKHICDTIDTHKNGVKFFRPMCFIGCYKK